MATRRKPTKPEAGEELIGTITPHGIRLTRDAWRAQLAYRERKLERVQTTPRSGLLNWIKGLGRKPAERAATRRTVPRSIEWRISWSSDAPFRMHFAVARWTVPTTPDIAPASAALADTSDADKAGQRARSPRQESAPRRETAPTRRRRSERAGAGQSERQAPRLESGRGSRARSRPR
jgi:hypothetical protein